MAQFQFFRARLPRTAMQGHAPIQSNVTLRECLEYPGISRARSFQD
jgi:hypothetical protein